MKLDADLFFIIIISTVLGGIGAWLAVRYAFPLGFVDTPSKRSSHDIPTPKGGGIGILGTVIVLSIYLKTDFAVWIPVSLLSLFSLAGDRKDLSPLLRLMFQFFFAAATVAGLYAHTSISSVFAVLPVPMIWLFSIFYIVATANFYNFMDGINGIAGITGVIAFGILGCYGVAFEKVAHLPILCFGVSAACLGFLPFNLPSAKVFMGDAGSILLGFLFSVIILNYSETLKEFFILSCLLFPFYADEFMSIVERLLKGRSLIKPHRRHLYQVLANEAELPHWLVTAGYGLFQLIMSLLVLFLLDHKLSFIVTVLFIITCIFSLLSYRIKSFYVSQ